MTTYLKFDSRAEAIEALPQFRSEDAWITHHDSTNIDVIGVIYLPPGEMLETNDGPVPEYAPIDGWHISLLGPVSEGLGPYIIDPPTTPARVFAGE